MTETLDKRAGALTIACLTGIYLLLELPFSAHLLDIVGTTSDVDIIHETEVLGRLISGFAVTLFLWGAVILPFGRSREWPLGVVVFACIATALPVMPGVYFSLEKFIDVQVENTTAEQRQEAFAILLFTREMQQNRAAIQDFPLTPDQLRQADGKTFLALAPFAINALPDARDRLEPHAREFARNYIKTEIGGYKQFYNDAYLGALEELHKLHEQYREGLDQVYAEKNRIDEIYAEKWVQYTDRVQSRLGGWPPSASACPRIRSQVRREGVAVPSDWNCRDQRAFETAITAPVYRGADNSFARETSSLFGSPLPQNLGRFRDFLAHPSVQARWRDSTGVPEGIELEDSQSLQTFRKEVYDPMIEIMVNDIITRYNAQTAAFEVGGAFYSDGERAMRALIVPPIALMFSLLGAFGHLIKLSATLLTLLAPTLSIGYRISAVVISLAMVLTVPLLLSNTVTRSKVYSALEEQTRTEVSFIGSYMVRWVMRAQPLLYPLADEIRHLVRPVYSPANNPVTQWVSGATPEELASRSRPPPLADSGTLVQRASKSEPAHMSLPAPKASDGVVQNQPTRQQPPSERPDRELSNPQVTTVACPANTMLHAHRGLSVQAPENSTESVIAAFDAGFYGAEIDVQRTSDGHWVLHHDLTTGRTVRPAGRTVRNMPLQSWRASTLVGTDDSPPTLSEVILASKPHLESGQHVLNIELKDVFDCAAIQDFQNFMRDRGLSSEDYVLASVDPRAVRCMGKHFSGMKSLVVVDKSSAEEKVESLQSSARNRLGAWVDKAVDRLRGASDEITQGQLSANAMEQFARDVPPPRAMYISGAVIERDPFVLQRAQQNSIDVFTYSVNQDDRQQFSAIKHARGKSGLAPKHLIVDGGKEDACRAFLR
jgi:glycerophosphoryl diester phosphodiesterase